MNLKKKFLDLEPAFGMLAIAITIFMIVGDILFNFSDFVVFLLTSLFSFLMLLIILQHLPDIKKKMMQKCSVCNKKIGQNKITNIGEGNCFKPYIYYSYRCFEKWEQN